MLHIGLRRLSLERPSRSIGEAAEPGSASACLTLIPSGRPAFRAEPRRTSYREVVDVEGETVSLLSRAPSMTHVSPIHKGGKRRSTREPSIRRAINGARLHGFPPRTTRFPDPPSGMRGSIWTSSPWLRRSICTSSPDLLTAVAPRRGESPQGQAARTMAAAIIAPTCPADRTHLILFSSPGGATHHVSTDLPMPRSDSPGLSASSPNLRLQARRASTWGTCQLRHRPASRRSPGSNRSLARRDQREECLGWPDQSWRH